MQNVVKSVAAWDFVLLALVCWWSMPACFHCIYVPHMMDMQLLCEHTPDAPRTRLQVAVPACVRALRTQHRLGYMVSLTAATAHGFNVASTPGPGVAAAAATEASAEGAAAAGSWEEPASETEAEARAEAEVEVKAVAGCAPLWAALAVSVATQRPVPEARGRMMEWLDTELGRLLAGECNGGGVFRLLGVAPVCHTVWWGGVMRLCWSLARVLPGTLQSECLRACNPHFGPLHPWCMSQLVPCRTNTIV